MSYQIKVSETDFVRLQKLLTIHPNSKLHEELERADIIKDILVTPDLVTVDSKIVYTMNNEILESTLVFPKVPEEQQICISVLDDLGTALLGLCENQQIEWLFKEGKKLIRVLSVVYQPEAMGDEHPLCFS